MIRDRRRRRGTLVACGVVIAVSCSCSPGGTERATAPPPAIVAHSLQPVALPALDAAEEGVRRQAQELYDALLAAMKSRAGDAALADAYGRLAMFLHAAEYLDAALPSYQNAATLAPGDARWPYYLALVYTSNGRTPEAVGAFQRALMLAPDDVPAMIRLAKIYIDQGQLDSAEPLLTAARARAADSVPVIAALGQVALARRQYDSAVRHFEEALAINPGALSLHAPLASAYRGLGRSDRAEAHLKLWRNREIVIPDPRSEQLELQVPSGLSFELRGLQAMRAQDWKAAVTAFREGLAVAPAGTIGSRSLQHKLGTALYMSGDVTGAVKEFRLVARSAPAGVADEPAARANYSLGVLMMSGGRFREAVDYLEAAVASGPNYVEAYMALGDALRRLGRFGDAAKAYQDVVRIDPASVEARFAYAVTLVHLGRYLDARAWLTESLVLHREEPMLMQALARILAAAPDARVRDGRRSLELAQQLARTAQTIDVGETLAMAFAEMGDFSSAVQTQKDVLAAAAQAGLHDIVPPLTANLSRYERRQPCRTPWADQDPVNSPGPPVVPELAAVAKELAAK
jgi:tetratricopeptide (TPR) repeat protein